MPCRSAPALDSTVPGRQLTLLPSRYVICVQRRTPLLTLPYRILNTPLAVAHPEEYLVVVSFFPQHESYNSLLSSSVNTTA